MNPHAWTHQAAAAATATRRTSDPASTSPSLGATLLISPSPDMLTAPNSGPAASYYDPSDSDRLGHMAFKPPVSASSSTSPASSSHLHPRSNASKARESHDSKRIKVESTSHAPSETMPAPIDMDNTIFDCMVRFDDDPHQFRSFEIDYSKINGPTGQSRFMTEMVPRLGSGFYAKAAKSQGFAHADMPAPAEEDYIDDNAFDNALSDDEETADNANPPGGPSADVKQPPQPGMLPLEQPRMEQPLMQQPHMQQPYVEQPPMAQPPMGQPHMEQPRAEQQPRAETTPSTGSYSAPHSWEGAQLAMPPSTMGLASGPMWESVRQSSAAAAPAAAAPMTGNSFVLSPEERRRLIEIALGSSGLPMYTPPNRFNFNMGNEYLHPSMHQANPISMRFGIGNDPAALRVLSTDSCAPEPPPTPQIPPSAAAATAHARSVAASAGQSGARDLKARQQHYRHHPRIDTTTAGMHARVSSAASRRALADAGAKGRSVDRVAHNDVERKYRTNLRDKIAELRNAVPVLRQAYDSERSPAAASSKVSKGTVLTKATEYIQHLEQRNRDIMSEHQQLTHRLQAFETLLRSSLHAEMMPSHSMALFDPRGFC